MLDAEDFSLIGQIGLGHRLQQPLRGGKTFAVGQADGGTTAHAEEGIARDGVQRLNAAIQEHRQAAEGGDVESINELGRLRAGEEPEGKNGGGNEGDIIFSCLTPFEGQSRC